MSKLCCVALLYGAPFLRGQDAMVRLVAESAPLRVNEKIDLTKQKDALRDWIESRLPANLKELDAGFANLQAQLDSELDRSGVAESENSEVGAGYVSRLELSRTAEFPGALVVRQAFRCTAVRMILFMCIASPIPGRD